MQRLPLGQQPASERWIDRLELAEQACGRTLALQQNCVRLAPLGAGHHLPQVDLERIAVDFGDVLVGIELVESDPLEGLADLIERLPQGGARLGLLGFTPQQADQPLARLLAGFRQRQVAEQRPRLAPVQSYLAIAVANRKVAEGFDPQAQPLVLRFMIRYKSIRHKSISPSEPVIKVQASRLGKGRANSVRRTRQPMVVPGA